MRLSRRLTTSPLSTVLGAFTFCSILLDRTPVTRAQTIASASSAYLGTPQSIPGIIKPEFFDYGGQGVAYNDVSTSSAPKMRTGEYVNGDTDKNLVYIAAGEWIRWTVNVQWTGTYSVKYSLATVPPVPYTMEMYLSLDTSAGCKGTKQADVIVPNINTVTWSPVSFSGADMYLTAGLHTLTVCFVSTSYMKVFNIQLDVKNTIAPTPVPTTQKPTVLPTAIPTPAPTMAAFEVLLPYYDYTSGVTGQALNYYDTTPGNTQAIMGFRTDQDVDASSTILSSTVPGEWVQYTRLWTAGIYDVYLEGTTSLVAGGTIQFFTTPTSGNMAPGTTLSTFTFGPTGGWSNFQLSQILSQVYVPSGTFTMRLTILNPANMKRLLFSGSALPPGGPYMGIRQAIPGVIVSTGFDEGGLGVAYMDLSSSLQPPIRAGETVGGTGNGVSWTAPGEWIRYSVNVAASGTYGVNYILAGAPSTPLYIDLRLVIDSTDCSKNTQARMKTLFRTGTWTTPIDFGGGDIYLSAGAHRVTVCFISTASTIFFGLRFGAAGSGSIVPPASFGSSTNSVATTQGYGNWPLRWADEFKGTALNSTIWGISTGNRGGWGNHELESYSSTGLRVANDVLVVEARKELSTDGVPYISGKTYSRGERGFNFKYGRLETRINMGVSGQGLWPAFWCLPYKYDGTGVYGKWPASGEIDLLEAISDYDSTYHTIHYGTSTTHVHQSCQFYAGGTTGSWENGWHVFAVEWAPWGQFKFYVDGTLACDISGWWIPDYAFPAPFDQPFYVMANLAVGGFWPEWVDDTIFANGVRHSMLIDYVRVYDWPTSRRLDELPEGWDVPQNWDLEQNTWKNVEAKNAEHAENTEGVDTNLESIRKAQEIEGQFWPNPSKSTTDTENIVVPPEFPVELSGFEYAHEDAYEADMSPDTVCAAQPYNRVRGTDWIMRPQPWQLPTSAGGLVLIGAEYYDNGGQGCGYYETQPGGNTGNCKLRGDNVDIFSYDNADSGPYVGTVGPGEWLQYTVEAKGTTTIAYAFEVVGFGRTDTVFKLTMDSAAGCDGGTAIMPGRVMLGGSSSDWRMYGTTMNVSPGVHTVRLCVLQGSGGNFDFIRIMNAADVVNGDGSYGTPYTSPEPQPRCMSHSCLV